MTWDWNQISFWLASSIIGGGIVLFYDLARERFKQRQAKNESKIEKILSYINEYGELVELYRFFAFVSGSIVRDESGKLLKDNEGNYVTEDIVLEPEPQFKSAIEELKETDINSAIAQKIVTIRLSSAEILDLSLEIDPSGSIKKGFSELFVKTIFNIGNILKNKNMHTPNQNF